jgi:cytochrome oxidase assembly protein ShyY1
MGTAASRSSRARRGGDVEMLKRLREQGLFWPTLFTLAGVAALIGVGNWQIQRKAWKDQLIQTIKVRSTAAPLPPEAWRELQCERSDWVG